MLKTICSVLLLLSSFSIASAKQESARTTSSASTPLVTAGSRAEGVRFAAPSSVAQIHLQVYTEAGQVVFDAASKGNVLDWSVEDGSGRRLATGSYVCVVTVKSLAGKLSQRLAALAVHEQQSEFRSIEAAQLTVAQQREIGPVEAD